MRVACEVPGDRERDRELDLPEDATYGDVVRAVGYSVHEAAVLVDGTPVPEDAPVESERVTVLRLVQGG
jgi:sulfur carrier protein